MRKTHWALSVILASSILAGCANQQQELVVPEIDSAAEIKPENQKKFSRGDVVWAQWPTRVQETSGLAKIGTEYWTLNDSGDRAQLYALNAQGKLIKTVKVQGASNKDWESLAQDDQYLYIADCGNNSGKRKQLTIYKVAIQTLQEAADKSSVSSSKISYSYGDYPANYSGRKHNFDCEALTVVGDQLWLFSKNRGDEKTKLYKLDKHLPRQSILPVAEYDVDGLITGADYDAENQRIILLGYEANLLFGRSFIWLLPVQGTEPEVNWQKAQRINLSPYAQWEAVLWDKEQKQIFLTCERSPLLDVGSGFVTFKE